MRHPRAASKLSNDPRFVDRRLAWDYDKRNPRPESGELQWYLRYARKVGDPILELGCGSGRLLIPFAAGGYRIDGVDISAAMLERLRGKLLRAGPTVRKRTRAYHADMMRFTSTRRYALVIVANNSLQYLGTRENHRRCFRHIHGLVASGGYFLAMIARTDLSYYDDDQALTVDWMDAPLIDAASGCTVGARIRSHLDRKENRVVFAATYVIDRGLPDEQTVEHVRYRPLISPDEYLRMLSEAGFSADVYSGYDEQPEDGTSQAICLVAQKEG